MSERRRRLLGRWLPVVPTPRSSSSGSSIPGDAASTRASASTTRSSTPRSTRASRSCWRARSALRRWWLAIVVGALYGVSDEFHQTFTPMRSGNDLGDITADVIGSTIGATAWMLLLRRRPADGTKSA